MRINVAVPEAHVGPEVLNAALEATTRLNESLIEQGEVPLFEQALAHGVTWKPEPPGDEHFDHAKVVLGRKWGDCDDLAPYHAASLRATGEDPHARAIVKRSGPKRWHAIVRRGNGAIDDPSAAAGMHEYVARHGLSGIMGAGLVSMFPQTSGVDGTYVRRPALALRPISAYGNAPEAWQARADLPWHWMPGESPTDIAMASLHASPISSQAIVGACRGAALLGEANDIEDDVLDRLDCIADACEGWEWEDLADEYGEEHATAAGELVDGFFGKLVRAVTAPVRAVASPLIKTVATPVLNVARMVPGVSPALNLASKALPIASAVAPFIPGIGPVASMALQAASPALQDVLRSGRHLPPQLRPAFPGAAAPAYAAPMQRGYFPAGGMTLRCVPFG